MNIVKCYITNFGCYSDKTFDFSPNLNPFFLKNGEGKTTLSTFIKAMLYSFDKTTKTSYDRKHYKPYFGGEYGGFMEINLDGSIYRIERTFADSPTKDTLKIYDSTGVLQTIFLSKQLSLLQGENSAKLGELILGIDSASFIRCNYISSEDLGFTASESVKMKIGNIVIDREYENSYEDTYESIVSVDLREKAPTKKNENAYPYRIKELEKKNKQIKDQIQELNELALSLKSLYQERDNFKSMLNIIEQKQKSFSNKHVLKGKMTTVEEFNSEIKRMSDLIDKINFKYNNYIPTKAEIEFINSNVKEYEDCVTIGDAFIIKPSDIEQLKKLEGKVVSDEDYIVLADANSKITSNKKKYGINSINVDRLEQLKTKFESIYIMEDSNLIHDYYAYKTLVNEEKKYDKNFQNDIIDYPSENVLNHIDSEIKEFNKLSKENEELILSYKEVSMLGKILLIIITFGIYAIILNKKKKNYHIMINLKENLIQKKDEELSAFFLKYNKCNGTYELRIAELKDDILMHKNFSSNNEEKIQKHKEEIETKKNSLSSYFSSFGYHSSNIDENFNDYNNDLQEYRELIKDNDRNEKINNLIQKDINEQFNLIDDILKKNHLIRREDFVIQLVEIKDNLEFHKKYSPLYLNQISNDEKKLNYENNIVSLLNKHNLESETNFIIYSKDLVKEIEEYNKIKESKMDLIEKREKFVKDNNLDGFVVDNIEYDEENFRKEHEQISASLEKIEDEINQIELNVSTIEVLNDTISENLELIRDYKEKITIAEIAAKTLEKAQSEMECKYIDPIKKSFVSYAIQIYEKIGLNVNMNYDYEIKYDIKGQLRDSKDLSDGERTIMMLALRFAVLDYMYKNHNSLIILDDPFESLDSEKLIKSKELIKSLSLEWQIIYFTCHESRTL